MSTKIRILVVDDSPVMRKILIQAFSRASDFEVVGSAADPFEARELLIQLKPDVMTLDLDLPKMDGLSFLERIMEHMPTRVAVISAFAQSGSVNALRALELGALDVIEKPSMAVLKDEALLESNLLNKIRIVAKCRLSRAAAEKKVIRKVELKDLDPKIQLIAIASSTGGTEALKRVFDRLPDFFPPIVVVQHMPKGFTKTYAEGLNKRYNFTVVEASAGDKLVAGSIYIAPGDFHMEVRAFGGYYSLLLNQLPPKHSVRPAADILMASVAKHAGPNALGVVLTGMGKDGAQGLRDMKDRGAYTMAQSEKTCVVYGMPAAAVALGAVDEIADLDVIGEKLTNKFLRPRAAA